MQNKYKDLTKSILETNNINSYQQMKSILTEYDDIKAFLEQGNLSEESLFVFTEILSKNILNDDVNLFHVDLADIQDSTKNVKYSRFNFVFDKIVELFLRTPRLSHLSRSLKNLIVVGLKALIERSQTRQIFMKYLRVFLPEFEYDKNILLWQDNPSPCIIHPRQSLTQKFIIGISILVDLVQYTTAQDYTKTYYYFRKNIYGFRIYYLPIYIQIAVSYGKLILPNKYRFQNEFPAYIKLLHSIIKYPFVVKYQQTNGEGLTFTESCFPIYFRSLLCDYEFIKLIMSSYLELVQQTVNFEQQSMMFREFIEIIGKICSASQYSFKNNAEVILTRSLYSRMALLLLQNYKFYDTVYICYIINIHKLILNNYTRDELKVGNYDYMLKICTFGKSIITSCKIEIEDGSNNAITYMFDLIHNQIINGSFELQNQQMYLIFDDLVCVFLHRISDQAQISWIKANHNWSEEEEAEKFYQFLNPIINVVLWLPDKLKYFEMYNMEMMNQDSSTFWMYLANFTLVNSSANIQQTQVILKYFFLALQTKNMASLEFINTAIEEMFSCFDDNEPNTTFWIHAQDKLEISFITFVTNIIQECFTLLESQNKNILEGVLKIFQTIYKKLKKISSKNVTELYSYISERLLHLEETSLSKHSFYKVRIKFHKIVSIIWINNGKYGIIKDVYGISSAKTKQCPNLVTFGFFLNDLTGYFQPIISPKSFQILFQLAFEDLSFLFNMFLNPTAISAAFSNENFLKSYTKFVHTLICGCQSKRFFFSPHSQIPLKIYELVIDSLSSIINFDYDGIILQIWYQIPSLNPLANPLPLHPDMASKNNNFFPLLIRGYFENFSKFTSLQSLLDFYPYIKNKLDNLCEWWNQIIEQNYHPDINVFELVECRIWTALKEQTTLSKLVYRLGKYDRKYWQIEEGMSEQEFMKEFFNTFKVQNLSLD